MKKYSSFANPRHFIFTSLFLRSWQLVALVWLFAVASGIGQTLYWDQNGATAGTGGTGNWGTASTWRLSSDTGTLQSWDNGGAATAVLGGTGGTITVGSASLLLTGATMAALNVNSTGYTITSAAQSRPLVVSGSLTLASSVSLTLNLSSTAGHTWSFGTISFGSGSALTVQGTATANNSNRVDLTANGSTITGGSITLAGTGVGPTGFVSTAPSGSPIQVTLNTNILNNSATSATMLGANNSNTLIYGGVVSGTARLQISGGQDGGAGIVVLTNNSTYTGDTYFNQTSTGVTRLGITDALPTTTTLFLQQSAGAGTVSTGGTLDLAGFNQNLAGVDGAGRGIVNTGAAATLTLGGSGSYTLTSQIGIPTTTTNLTAPNNNITVVKNGSGTQTLSGSKAFTGGLYINSGLLRAAGSVAALGAAPASPATSVFVRGGTLAMDTTAGDLDSTTNRGFEVGPTSGAGSVTIQVEGTNSFIVRGNIADTPGGSGRIIKTGTGILRLQTNAKTYTGGLSILEGTVSLSVDDRIGAVPASPTPGSILVNGGTLLATDTYTLHANRGIALGPDTGSGSGTLSVSSGTMTYEGIIANNSSGAGRLIKTGDGTLRLQNSPNTFSGGVTILGGDLSVGVDNRLGLEPLSATAGSIVLSGGALTITADMTLSSNRGIAIGPSSGSGTGAINVTSSDTLTYGGIIADNPGGSGRLVKSGTGTLRLISNANTFTGGLTVSGGLLSFSLENRLGAVPGSPTAGSIILNGGGLRLTQNDVTLNSNRGIALGPDTGSGTGVFNVDTGVNLTYGGIIANNGLGSGALEKTQAGGLILGGANTYSGGTTLTGGTLIVTNTSGSATGTGSLTTAAGTTLAGTGTIVPTGANAVSVGGSVAPGLAGVNNGIGAITFTPANGNVTFQSTSSIAFELGGNGINDQIVFNATGSGLIDFSAMLAGSLGVSFASGYTPALGHSFDLIDWSALSGPAVAGLSDSLLGVLPTAGFDPSWSWNLSQFLSSGTISISTSIVPEPSRLLMLMAGVYTLISRRRR
ncbi:MAG: autotransporter-associated beta strand repeat-containing protein [Verrucomicrobiota bacterium]